jgi:hypothetical protein
MGTGLTRYRRETYRALIVFSAQPSDSNTDDSFRAAITPASARPAISVAVRRLRPASRLVLAPVPHLLGVKSRAHVAAVDRAGRDATPLPPRMPREVVEGASLISV